MNFTFGNYKIEPTAPLLFDETANARQNGPQLPQTPLRLAALNVLNFFSTLDDSGPICGPGGNAGCRGADSASELQRQSDKLVATILAMDADIIGLMEIENNATASLQALVDALNTASNPGTWAFINTGTIGNDVIKVGLIYQPAAVTPLGDFAILDASVDPRFDSSRNRPSLAQTFAHTASGEVLTVDVNHLKSKGCGGASGADADQGDGQACFNASRTAAAEALADWLATDPTASGDPDYIVLGDLNAYSQEDPIRALTDSGLVDIGQQFDAARTPIRLPSLARPGRWTMPLPVPRWRCRCSMPVTGTATATRSERLTTTRKTSAADCRNRPTSFSLTPSAARITIRCWWPSCPATAWWPLTIRSPNSA